MPGELIQDSKFLEGRKRYQYTAIDVVSKWRYLRAYSKLNQANSLDFIDRLREKAQKKGINLKLVQTDNGPENQSEVVSHLPIWALTINIPGSIPLIRMVVLKDLTINSM